MSTPAPAQHRQLTVPESIRPTQQMIEDTRRFLSTDPQIQARRAARSRS